MKPSILTGLAVVVSVFFISCTHNTSPSDPSSVSYAVSFDSQGGSSVSSQSVADGGHATEPTAPTKSGYDFAGWYKESSCVTAWNFQTDTVTADRTLYAKWTAQTNTPSQVAHTVTFDSQGGSSVSSQSVADGGHATEPTAPTKSGYDFAGWYKESSCVTTWNFQTDTVTADRTLYAKWTAQVGSGDISIDPYQPVSVTITVDSVLAYGSSLTASAHATDSVDGYVWYIDGQNVGTGSSVTVSDVAYLPRGPHTLMVVVSKDNASYSQSALVTVK